MTVALCHLSSLSLCFFFLVKSSSSLLTFLFVDYVRFISKNLFICMAKECRNLVDFKFFFSTFLLPIGHSHRCFSLLVPILAQVLTKCIFNIA